MFFFGPISSSALQSFANKIIFISHKKSFLGRFFITTKINFISQKDFHFDLGQTPGMFQEFLDNLVSSECLVIKIRLSKNFF